MADSDLSEDAGGYGSREYRHQRETGTDRPRFARQLMHELAKTRRGVPQVAELEERIDAASHGGSSQGCRIAGMIEDHDGN